ncbi:MAG: UvrD-helicase domain-containing protein [Sedimentisphaerales bacterium]|nr:UvrD-helicase domain-containing protein [Sedimentisphaerales bacterium]
MEFIADFHIHSHFSIATSRELDPEHLDYWGRIKGIKVVGTGDFTHPGWLAELKEKCEPAEAGLLRLKPEYRVNDDGCPSETADNSVRFILSAEISTIYKKGDKVRKVHHVILAPDFETVEKIQQSLSRIGNITSDGRPILGLDSRHLLEIALEASERIFFIPAHIWTPWFSALGDKSGFDTIDDCYDDLASHIHAVETGLSSDPPMNWRCSFLDKYTIISNSDAHSPQKLGREANLFNTELSYSAITDALASGDARQFLGTVEFFPQEGKYHHDGHRKCNISWDPLETARYDSMCPVCGKKVTVGVMNRVMQLADRNEPEKRGNRSPFYSMIPLKEVLSEILKVGPNSKKVTREYHDLIRKAGSEFNVLLHLPLGQIHQVGGEVLAEAIRRMRAGDVHIKEGFDGEFGVIKVFTEDELKKIGGQSFLFDSLFSADSGKKEAKIIEVDQKAKKKTKESVIPFRPEHKKSMSENPLENLNSAQHEAVEHGAGPALIIAGPGTGKTHVLTCRVYNLIHHKNISPDKILAVTFTNKAAGAMRQRLQRMLAEKEQAEPVTISTFHALGYHMLKEQRGRGAGLFEKDSEPVIIDPEDKKQILLKEIGCDKKQFSGVSEAITQAKQNLLGPEKVEDKFVAVFYQKYQDYLSEHHLLDLDDLIFQPVRLLRSDPAILSHYRRQFAWIMVDEYQDVNFAQYQLIRTLMPDVHANLCVIGDPNQAIYGFRGADVRFINQFIRDYPGSRVYKLQTSYRCSDNILQASGQVVAVEESEPASMLQGVQEGVKIQISVHPTDKSEAEFVARTIERMMGGLRFFSMDSDISTGEGTDQEHGFSDFAVLCRVHSQIPALEKAFRDHSIPWQEVKNQSFFKQKTVCDILDILQLTVNPENSYLAQKIKNIKIFNDTKFRKLKKLLEKPQLVKQSLGTIIDVCYSNNEREDSEFLFKELFRHSEDFGDDIQGFLKFVMLGTSIDTYRSDTEQVSLMTLHGAKGLEFNCVFIVGCEDGLLPYSLYQDRRCDRDEERRLLYVGMTRARRFLYLTHAKKRFLQGRHYTLARSPFLETIEKELIETSQSQYQKRTKKPADRQPTLF